MEGGGGGWFTKYGTGGGMINWGGVIYGKCGSCSQRDQNYECARSAYDHSGVRLSALNCTRYKRGF